MYPVSQEDLHRLSQRAELYRKSSSAFEKWARGVGVIRHTDETQVRVFDLCQQLHCMNRFSDFEDALAVFAAADHLANAAMWLVVHMTYASTVRLNGSELKPEEFKLNPQGHTGGSLNMVPAYIGYMAANTLGGITRSWLMGQGHCVSAIDSVNVLLRNLHAEQAERYTFSDDGLTALVSDFYSYVIDEEGKPSAPLGSHVNAHTAGGLIEGGYLGFAELQYVHMPLPGERLVAFLSDGAFEEQRGSDWASRWWRSQDSGMVTPIMIANGRRIDQRSTMYQQGGLSWFHKHLSLNGFYPIAIDGRDPAAFIWGIFESESRLQACGDEIQQGRMSYPVRLPYLIAETIKGFGFFGAGTNAAHGTPLPGNPGNDAESRGLFEEYTRHLWIDEDVIKDSADILNSHKADKRVRERDHALSRRHIAPLDLPEPEWLEPGLEHSPMSSIDGHFCRLLLKNPELRVRVGNPDEIRSNRMSRTLEQLKHRVLEVENGSEESVLGAVITALNEEAVVNAALGNKGGINLVISYEAFAVKMLGALRQEIIFSRHQKEVGRQAMWLSVPVIATSHLWENGKNEQSHQDSIFGEALMAEMSDVSRVVFPADSNSAMACLNACYESRGQVWAMTVPKQPLPGILSEKQAQTLIRQGALVIEGDEASPVQLVAIGAYQLQVALEVSRELSQAGIEPRLIYMLEPGRFRSPRDQLEKEACVDSALVESIFPSDCSLRVFISHFHADFILGICRPLDLGPGLTLTAGYKNKGGTLDTQGMLMANQSDTDSLVAVIKHKFSQ